MKLKFSGKKISGLALVVPENERKYVDDMARFNFSPAKSMRLMKVMGYDRHRIVEDGVCASDLVEYGMRSLIADGKLKAEEIDALVYVTATPDHFLPPTSRILHGKLGLRQDALCFDLTQGCSGFEEGLIQAFMLLGQSEIKKVVIATGDTLSRKVSPRDRNSYPLIGDAASIAVIENDPEEDPIYAVMRNDGTRCMALTIPAGCFRKPCSPETAEMKEDAEGNFRSEDNLVMDGSGVFNFVMADVPPMLAELCAFAGTTYADYDWFLFHQPNKFMLEKLADKLGVAYDKMPSNVVEKYGNSSGTTVPAVIALNLAERLKAERFKVCLSGFGVGLTWGAVSMNLGPLSFCETVQYPNRSK